MMKWRVRIKMVKLKKLAVCCGGTGGHFFPGLSSARVFKEQGGEVLLLLSGIHAVEQCKIAESAGVPALALPEMPHYSKHPIRFVLGFLRGCIQAEKALKKFSPQAMLAMGSFAALPVVRAAVKCRIPLFLHDGNARIGKANRFFSRWAKFMGSAFPAVNSDACRCPVEAVGMPLRPELDKLAKLEKTAALDAVNREFGSDFSTEYPLILITGGSLGAAVFNTVLPQAFTRIGTGFQVVHLTGRGKLAEAEKIYRGAKFPYLLRESTGKMGELLAASDLVFSRSGGSTAAELALFGKPSVLIPYPFAAEGHQLDNARYFESGDGAVVVENPDLTVENAEKLLLDYLNDPAKWQKQGDNMYQLARGGAANIMLTKIDGMI